ncbi:MAG: diacylglycerol kinase family protein [Clostridia bacterium]|nr:diacylglycerol kinase family protein [Clostridia bacterium]
MTNVGQNVDIAPQKPYNGNILKNKGKRVMKKYALYNSAACSGRGKSLAARVQDIYPDDEIVFQDVCEVPDYVVYLEGLGKDAPVVICGGDGTLNRFINATKDKLGDRDIYYFPCGSGNDFMRDVGAGEEIVRINDYIKDLPTVYVNGKEYAFLNGVGYGIDGYCCEKGDEIREKTPEKKISYAGIAIKGLLFHYKPTTATVTVDGEMHTFKNAWLVPTMYGRYYGGGMIPCPEQSRNNPDKKVSVMAYCGKCKLKVLMIFPSLFKGEHVKHKKHITILSGHEITVKFDSPRALQIDGETILNVSEYTVKY